MKAAVLHGPRDIRVESFEEPGIEPGMVLLRSRLVGICGSDQHYYEHGYCAAFVPDRPFVLGHEVMAEVAAVAPDVATVRVGQRVAVNPARSCGFCDNCKAGRGNLCRKTIMLGSASTTPPTNGGLAELVAVRADQCHALPAGVDESLGALIEPFAVALHAVKRAGTVSGRRVLVTGAGAIGLLAAMTARAFGAVPVAVSDLVAQRRAKAEELGIDAVLDPSAADFADRARELSGEGFDVVLEASGAPPALKSAFDLVRPGGTIVQIGTLGTADIPLPANKLMNKEINLIGSMRYGNVFDEAIRLAAAGRVNLRPLINAVFPLEESAMAFEFAADKARSFKVLIQI
ncbi:MAG TPA: NAD(P)-dependent alcohol dehydrogenase [Terracidiphilus sp.]|jgi:L-idonate 5-dehydrogenase|nr:NAD(P)-dependent alcohol dehydrogenase [Terracidiphilus sp.]